MADLAFSHLARLPYHQDLTGCLAETVGGDGLHATDFAEHLTIAGEAVVWLEAQYAARSLPLLTCPDLTDDLADIDEVAAWLADGMDDVVCLGTGGSSLGGQSLAQAAGWRHPVAGDFRPRPRLHFLDNLDGASMAAALNALNLSRTRFFAVSKSGGTGETLIQLIAVLSALAEAGLSPSDHIVAVTEPGEGNKLRSLLEPEGVRIVDHMEGLGGRFVALSNVGLIPAKLAGADPAAVRAGARAVRDHCLAGVATDIADVPPATGAAVAVGLMREQGATLNVLMGYGDGFERLTRWWVQLWAESLGKEGLGLTPVGAIGPVDQHSQLQLFLDGPRDKLVTLLMRNGSGEGPLLDTDLAKRAGEPGFAGKHVGDFVWAQQCATADTLIRNGRPVRRIIVSESSEQTLGALMMHFMLETIIAAHVLGVNAFDQPAVEEGKVLAKSYLAGEAGSA
ncbi:MAG: glucose-6-phosphate isomerase [Pseudomonadota bacterium]